MPQVNQFNEELARRELKKCPKIVQEYFRLIQGHYEKQKELTALAIKKLREAAKNSSVT